jgi:two-component sensor histidine kinase
MPARAAAPSRLMSPSVPPLAELVIEANHRVANSLAIIAGLFHRHATALGKRTDSMEMSEVRLMLETFGARIGIVAGLHRRLAENSDPLNRSRIDLAKFLEDIAAAVVDSLSPPGQTKLHLDLAPNCFVESQRALSLGLVVGELVTNALKFAHPAGVPGLISIACRPGPAGTVIVEVADDGVGLPEGFDPGRKGATLGLPMVHGLAAQNEAQIRFKSTVLGLTVKLTLPRDAGH